MQQVSKALVAGVVSNAPVSERAAAGYFLLRAEAAGLPELVHPGQFVLLRPAPAATDPLLGRPLAIFDADGTAQTVSFLYIPAGRGTTMLSNIEAGGEVFLNGPLGKGFQTRPDTAVVGVAGGTGVAGVHFALKSAEAAGARTLLYLGARSRRLLLPPPALACRAEYRSATEDGSLGFHGTVVDLLRRDLAVGRLSGKEQYLVAGPVPMMQAAAALAVEKRLDMQVSLEARMACGLGACRGCIVAATAPHPLYGFMHRAVCTDGPVFQYDAIDWRKLG